MRPQPNRGYPGRLRGEKRATQPAAIRGYRNRDVATCEVLCSNPAGVARPRHNIQVGILRVPTWPPTPPGARAGGLCKGRVGGTVCPVPGHPPAAPSGARNRPGQPLRVRARTE
jgi:hypothetical protein